MTLDMNIFSLIVFTCGILIGFALTRLIETIAEANKTEDKTQDQIDIETLERENTQLSFLIHRKNRIIVELETKFNDLADHYVLGTKVDEETIQELRRIHKIGGTIDDKI